MKKVLLTTTAMAFAASMASAGDSAMSGSIKLTYGAFGTGSAVGGTDGFTSEADLDVAATSAGGNISMSGTLELDEDGNPATGPVSISTGALTFTYDANDRGALARTNAADGEDDNYGDYTIDFAAGGIAVSYTKDQESSDNAMSVSYAPGGALSLSLSTVDETTATGLVAAAAAKTTVGATYVTGPYTIALSGNDATVQEWDASVAMASGDTTVTVSSDETETMKVGISYTSGGMTASASQEFNNDDETEISLSYTDGALTFGAAHDSGQGKTAHYGDEAQLVISAAYVDGDVTVAAKGTDQDEMEVSVTFAF
jgi:membrane-bound inhibitor of C-type lysozyme